MMSGSVNVLMAALYFQDEKGNPKCKPKAAFISLCAGSLSRFLFQFALPHDYMFVIGGQCNLSQSPLHLHFHVRNRHLWLNPALLSPVLADAVVAGPGLYTGEKLDIWYNPDSTYEALNTVCPGKDLYDMSGVDSFLAPVVSLIALFIAQKLVKEDYYTATGYWFTPYTFNEDDSPKAEEPAKPVESEAAEA